MGVGVIRMEETMEAYLAYGATVYLLAYMLYLLVKAATDKGGMNAPSTPYDTSHLILRR